ncbi:hypothetical protein [Nocardiopsis gilva]|uniref:hypothetical protein n=1 Tax=Nocardiopsis gilva TaxID=280236 RepID=UPI0022B75CBD|nr:hypothetical protein [Nocardiopsis gilva]
MPAHLLARVCVLQFLEGPSDRQAAAAMRGRIDRKYLPACNSPTLDSTTRCSASSATAAPPPPTGRSELSWTGCARPGCSPPARQRTDSTRVPAAARRLNRLENTAEQLRAALNAIAYQALGWLARQVPASWFDGYGRSIEDDRLPRGEAQRTAFVEQTGRDGLELLRAVDRPLRAGGPGGPHITAHMLATAVPRR